MPDVKTFFDFAYDDDDTRCHVVINLEALVAMNVHSFIDDKLCLIFTFDRNTTLHSTDHYIGREEGEGVFNRILAAWDRVEGWRGYAHRVFVSPVRDTGERVAVGVHHIRHVFFKDYLNDPLGRLYIDMGHHSPLSLLARTQDYEALLDRIETWHTSPNIDNPCA